MSMAWMHAALQHKLNSASELFKCVGNVLPLGDSLLDSIIHSDQFRHEFQDLVQLIVGNGNDPFQRVADDNIPLRNVSNH